MIDFNNFPGELVNCIDWNALMLSVNQSVKGKNNPMSIRNFRLLTLNKSYVINF